MASLGLLFFNLNRQCVVIRTLWTDTLFFKQPNQTEQGKKNTYRNQNQFHFWEEKKKQRLNECVTIQWIVTADDRKRGERAMRTYIHRSVCLVWNMLIISIPNQFRRHFINSFDCCGCCTYYPSVWMYVLNWHLYAYMYMNEWDWFCFFLCVLELVCI